MRSIAGMIAFVLSAQIHARDSESMLRDKLQGRGLEASPLYYADLDGTIIAKTPNPATILPSNRVRLQPFPTASYCFQSLRDAVARPFDFPVSHQFPPGLCSSLLVAGGSRSAFNVAAQGLSARTVAHAATAEIKPLVEKVKSEKASGKIIVSPSVAKANFLNLGADLKAATEGGAEWLHFSVQDGRFVPKLSFGPPVIAQCRKAFPDTVFDVKLSMVEPENLVADFAKAGADIISVHPEASLQLPAVINKIRDAGIAAGVVLNPGTPMSAIEHIIEDVDVVVVMLVNPGWGGPKYMKEAIIKIKAIKELAAARGIPCPWIEVDGGVSTKNNAELIEAGANVLVAGGSVFTSEDKKATIDALKLKKADWTYSW